MASPAHKPMTLDDFLEWEERSPIRHEWRQGNVWAMSGATLGHGLVASAFRFALGVHLKGSPCRVIANNLQVLVASESAAYYPDLVVLCQGLEDRRALRTTTPTVLVEVFSPSTEDRDRGPKREDYSKLPSLREYVLVDPEEPIVIVRRRSGPKAEWRTESLGPEDEIVLPSIEFRMPVKALYEG